MSSLDPFRNLTACPLQAACSWHAFDGMDPSFGSGLLNVREHIRRLGLNVAGLIWRAFVSFDTTSENDVIK